MFDMPKSVAYELPELKAQHHEILRLKLQGMKNVDIAKQLGVTTAMVAYTVNGELGREHLETLSLAADVDSIDVAREIRDASRHAIQFLGKAVRGQVSGLTEKDRLLASQDMLDRAGHGKIQRVHARFDGYLSVMDEFKARAREVGIIDTSATSVEQVGLDSKGETDGSGLDPGDDEGL